MILGTFPLDFQWPTREPFLFCVHHLDRYPAGTGSFGPPTGALRGRNIGQDFEARDGYRMYHGEVVPGFPVHPHRGFETITIVRRGYVDHSDSLGAAGRYGEGDVQWMTAGAGVQHSEMFPLLRSDSENTLELFQIWLNLPSRSKMVPAHFKMFWSEEIPVVEGDGFNVSVISGEFSGRRALTPPPDSWAADGANEVMILLIRLSGGIVSLPAASLKAGRTLYVFEGDDVRFNGTSVDGRKGYQVQPDLELVIEGGSASPAEILVLQARPIGEPVVQHGPFVMNSRDEIIKTFEDYQKTRFGGWPWPQTEMVHGAGLERFARYPDGRVEKPRSV